MSYVFHFLSKRRRTIKNLSLGLLVVGVVFLNYQMLVIKLIEVDDKKSGLDKSSFYTFAKPSLSSDGTFFCVKSNKVIPASYLNDDYCDCPLDYFNGDETQTNACLDGAFFCRDNFKEVVIPSSRVNDGICDCCDGSDEWLGIKPHVTINTEVQRKLGQYLSPCPFVCDYGGR